MDILHKSKAEVFKRFVEWKAMVDSDVVCGDATATIPALRRSDRIRCRPDYYAEGAIIASNSTFDELRSFQEAMSSPIKTQWETAMELEMKSLSDNEVWELIELPKGCKLVGSKWVYKIKVDGDGYTERFNARLVAQGFTQTKGADYDETFSPVVRMESLQKVVGLAIQKKLKIHQLDVTTAFLNGKLQEEIYMKQPEGFVTKGREHLVCRLKRSLYGLKQSSRCWYATLDQYLKELGVLQSDSDPCVYIAAVDEMAIVGIYVDDIVIACGSEEQLKKFKSSICKRFNVKDLGKLHHFLGMKIVQDDVSGDI